MSSIGTSALYKPAVIGLLGLTVGYTFTKNLLKCSVPCTGLQFPSRQLEKILVAVKQYKYIFMD